jgi:hypothetical protein
VIFLYQIIKLRNAGYGYFMEVSSDYACILHEVGIPFSLLAAPY